MLVCVSPDIRGRHVRETVKLVWTFYLLLVFFFMLTTAPHMSSRRPLPTLHPPSLPSVPINRALSSCHARRHRQTLSPAATGRQRGKSLLKPAVVDSLFFFTAASGSVLLLLLSSAAGGAGGAALTADHRVSPRGRQFRCVSPPLRIQPNLRNISLRCVNTVAVSVFSGW